MAEGGALRDLLARFSVDVDTKSLTAFEHGIGGMFERLQKYASVFAGIFALNALKEFVSETIESAAQLKKLAGSLQVSTDEFQKIQAFLKGSTEETVAAIQRLNRGIGMTKAGEKSPIEKLGISLKDTKGQLKPTSELVLDMADKISAMKTPAEKTAAVFEVFGRGAGGLVRPLSMGREEAKKYFEQMKDLGGVVSEDFIEQSHKAEKAMKQFKIVMGGIKRDAVAALLPTVIKLAEGFKKLALSVRHLLGGTNAIQHFFTLLKFAGVASGIYKIVTALRALSIATLTNPWVLLIVGAIALFLVIDDLWTLLEGGDSLIGDALGPDKQALVDALRDAFNGLKDTLADLMPAWDEIKKAVGEAIFDKLIEGLYNTFRGITLVIDAFQRLGEAIDDIKGGKLNFAALMTGDFQHLLPESPNQTGNVKGAIEGTRGQTAVASVPNKLDQSVKVNNQNTIHVSVENPSPGDSPDTVGKAIGQGIRTKLDQQNVDALNAGKKR